MNKILIVEDEEAIANLIYMNLKNAGYFCEIAYDGQEGADKLSENHYDLCLLDIMLPKINGYELLSYAKSMEIPVIFLTASGYEDDVRNAISLGAVNYLKKPFFPKELLKRVARGLEEQ